MSRTRITTVASVAAFLIVIAAAAAKGFPEVIALPDGWRPEGIEAGRQHVLYVGSIPTGAVRQVDAQTGDSFTLVQPTAGRAATGLEYDRLHERLFVSGGGTGHAYVYDARTGAPLADYTLTPAAPTFINDAVFTKHAVFFTESMRPWLYRLPLGHAGALPAPSEVETIPLSGDYVQQPGLNLNGIVATNDARTLIAVQTPTASLFKIDAETGVADRIELTGGDATNGDGLLLEGRKLYVVQNRSNRVELIQLAPDYGSGTVIGTFTNPALDVPTTIARSGGRLYLPNSRFGVASPDTASYDVVNLGKH